MPWATTRGFQYIVLIKFICHKEPRYILGSTKKDRKKYSENTVVYYYKLYYNL